MKHSTNENENEHEPSEAFHLPPLGTTPASVMAWVQAATDLFAARVIGKKAFEALLVASSKTMTAIKLHKEVNEIDELRDLVRTIEQVHREGDQHMRDIAQGRTPI